jgi:tRNA G18 (ribose-2'-O)-methylase SpoU
MARKFTTKEILQRNLARSVPGQMEEVIIFLHDIRSLHNVGAVFRNADAFGIKKIILSGVTPAPPRAEITKTAIGAEEFVEWHSINSPLKTLREIQKHHLIVGTEQTSDSVPLPDFTLPGKPLCLVFGNEVTGIDESLLPAVNSFVEIPQYGHKHSLNISVAAGVVLYGILQKYWKREGT